MKAINKRKQQRYQVLDLLGGYCIRCGFDDYRILQIDHINGNGKTDPLKKDRKSYYTKLLALPLDQLIHQYQLLCPNCNWLKRVEDHEEGYHHESQSISKHRR